MQLCCLQVYSDDWEDYVKECELFAFEVGQPASVLHLVFFRLHQGPKPCLSLATLPSMPAYEAALPTAYKLFALTLANRT
jgi:hypothetical protein